jgi:hypothetical protein
MEASRLPTTFRARVFCYAFLLSAASAGCSLIRTGTSYAAQNIGATASLTWSATDRSATDLIAPGATNNLFVYVERPDGLAFKGAELDLVWSPPGDLDGECFAHIGTVYKTSSGTTCTYLNRGNSLPVVTADEPGHFHVAWSNPTPLTTCTAGTIVQIQFAFDGCADIPGCFILNSLTLLDAANRQDAAAIVGPVATVLGGGETCGTLNVPPDLVDPLDQTVAEHAPVAFALIASDPNGDPITYGMLNPPAGGMLLANQFFWTPAADQIGEYDIVFTATDTHGASDSESVHITVVLGPNSPPVLASIGPQTVQAKVALSFPVSASDPQGDPVTLSAVLLPPGATFANDRFDWTPSEEQVGTYDVLFIATDYHGAADSELVTITVTPYYNLPPVLAPIGPQSTQEKSTLIITLSATDPDNDPLTYSASPLPPGATFAGQTFTWTPVIGQSGSYSVAFSVMDAKDGADSERVEITVLATPSSFYVDVNSPCGANCDGKSWATAKPDISAGALLMRSGIGDSLLVAEGQYSTWIVPVERSVIAGGYKHGGGARDPAVYRTSWHPLGGAAPVDVRYPHVTVDGFDFYGSPGNGIAMNVRASDVTIRSCWVRDWYPTTVDNVLTVDVNVQDVLIDRCVFTGVRLSAAQARGMVFLAKGSVVTVRDCDFVDNQITQSGTAGVYADALVSATLVNNVFWRLRPYSAPPIIADAATLSVTYCDVQGGWPGVGNLNVPPQFCDPKHKTFTLHSTSPLVGAGENGTTIGALDVGCGPVDEAVMTPNETAGEAGPVDDTVPEAPPARTSLLGVWPNMRSGEVAVRFGLHSASRVRVDVFDARGVCVRTVANASFAAGEHTVSWEWTDAEGRRVADGLYLLRFSAGDVRETRKVFVVR